MIALIPVAGAGAHLRPHTHTQPKPLLPIAGQPILDHLVAQLQEVGLKEFIFVLGHLGEKIQQHVTERYSQELTVHFVYQEPRLGLGHAIWLCRELVGQKPMLIALGDTLLELDLPAFLQSGSSMVAVQAVQDPTRFGVVQLDESGRISLVVEKPRFPKSNLALAGMYAIQESTQLFQALDHLMEQDLRTHNEYQLTDALQLLVEQGAPLHSMTVQNWFDCGKKEVLLQTNRRLLDRMAPTLPQPEYPGSVIIPPVTIAPGCRIEQSIIGPYVAIGESSTIRHSILRNAIVGSYTELVHMTMEESVVGNDTSLTAGWRRISIGDNTAIDFNA